MMNISRLPVALFVIVCSLLATPALATDSSVIIDPIDNALLEDNVPASTSAEVPAQKRQPPENKSPAPQSRTDWGVQGLNSIAGVLGAAQACKDQKTSDDAQKVHGQLINTMLNNGMLSEARAQAVFEKNRKTAELVKSDFLKNSPVTCKQLPAIWAATKDDLGYKPTVQ